MAALERANGIRSARAQLKRDLKAGRVKIVDLGIARLLEDDESFSRLSRTGRHAIGTPAYMAPEQIDPSFGPIGPWTDEYAAALIAYRLLTGKLPFEGKNQQEMMIARLRSEPIPASNRRPDLSEAVDRVLLKAMAREPGDRYQTAPEFAQALRAAAG